MKTTNRVLPGIQVRVYCNLHKKQYSVQEKVGRSWLVADHVDRILLQKATFRVGEAGRQRVLREKRKNVHAAINGLNRGYPFCEPELFHFFGFEKVTYNPYRAGFFYSVNTGWEVIGADHAWVTEAGVWVAGIHYGERIIDASRG